MPPENQSFIDNLITFNVKHVGALVKVSLYKKKMGDWKNQAVMCGTLISFTELLEKDQLITSFRFEGFNESIVLPEYEFKYGVECF